MLSRAHHVERDPVDQIKVEIQCLRRRIAMEMPPLGQLANQCVYQASRTFFVPARETSVDGSTVIRLSQYLSLVLQQSPIYPNS